MRHPIVFVLIVVVVTLLGATAVLYQSNRTAAADYEDMKLLAETAESRYTEAFTAIAEIQDSLEAITLSESEIQMLEEQLQTEQALGDPHTNEALDRIETIKAGVARTRDRINALESDLKQKGIETKSLNRMVGNLRKDLDQKEAVATGLLYRVDKLEYQISDLTAEVQQSQSSLRETELSLEQKRRELSTIYYIVRDKRALMDAGIIEAKGGVLGMGKTLKPTASFDTAEFTALDTDAEDVVLTRVEKVEVISAQPVDSYEIREIDGQLELHITDPATFRTVKHLIIMTS
jgi:chromosome segregation ATPase